ncbi:hypothetical protein [Kineococcus glutinatus]|uniref:DUF3592 domain-containing protein n=1 Tax=Kineococcus glutinatus TaxID=1070872 RepID=A0ABP9IC34_9ACTN
MNRPAPDRRRGGWQLAAGAVFAVALSVMMTWFYHHPRLALADDGVEFRTVVTAVDDGRRGPEHVAVAAAPSAPGAPTWIRTFSQYHTGDGVVVRYDPDEPDVAYVVGDEHVIYAYLYPGIVVMMVGGLIAGGIRRLLLARSARAAAIATRRVPVLAHEEDGA